MITGGLFSEIRLDYNTRCYFNVRSKADISQLKYRTEPATEIGKKLKSKNGYAQKYR